MRLLICSMPGVALVAILSVHMQRSIGYTRAQVEVETPALPATSRILHEQMAKGRMLRLKGAIPTPQFNVVSSQQLRSKISVNSCNLLLW